MRNAYRFGLALLLALVLAACGQAPTPPTGDNDNDENPSEEQYALFSALGPMTVVNPDGPNNIGLGMQLYFRSAEAATENIDYQVDIILPTGEVLTRRQTMTQPAHTNTATASSQFTEHEYTPGEYTIVVTDESGQEVARNQHILELTEGLPEISIHSASATVYEFTLNYDTVYAELVAVVVTRNADLFDEDAPDDYIVGGRAVESITESSSLTFTYPAATQLDRDDEFRVTMLAQENVAGEDANERAFETRFLYLKNIPIEVDF